MWLVCGCHDNQRAISALVRRSQRQHPTMLQHPALNTSSSLTTHPRGREQVRGQGARLRGGNEHRVWGWGMRRGSFARSGPHLPPFFPQPKGGLVDLERRLLLWPVANHVSLFLVPLCFDICSGLQVSFQPRAHDTRRQDGHMVCVIPFLTYLSPKVDTAPWNGVGPVFSCFTAVEEMPKCMFRNNRQYGKGTHARTHTHKEARKLSG